jgi:CheY-like chemotaxis protein
MIKVYYVDDEPELCELFVDIFASSKVLVSTFTNPSEALEKILSNPPDLIFMDYRMPGMNGMELAQKSPVDIKKYLISGENNISVNNMFEAILKKPLNVQLIHKIIMDANKDKV